VASGATGTGAAAGAAALGGAVASGVLFALAAPPRAWWPLAFVCLLPLLLALRGRGALARASLGALAGCVAAVGCAAGPAAVGASQYLGLEAWQGWLVTLAVGQTFGVIGFASFALLAGDPRRLGPAEAMARAGLALAVGEWLRCEVLSGLPWLLLAHALAPAPAAARLAGLGGLPLLSLWLGALQAGLAGLAPAGRRRPAAAGLLLLSAAAAAAALVAAPGAGPGPGHVRPAAGPAPAAGALRVALVQPALAARAWADPARAGENLRELAELSRAGVRGRGVDLVVWPENSLQVQLPANRHLVDAALATLRPHARWLLLGAPRFDAAAPARRFNAAHLFDTHGGAAQVHDKVKLLPFFEYAPAWWPGARGGDLSPGRAPVLLRVGEVGIGALVCYEVLFPQIAGALVADGAGLLVNVSNDAWFGGAGGARQHFAAAVLQALSLARPLLRSTPTGVTAAVDAWGRVAGALPEGRAGVLVVDVWPAAAGGARLRGERAAWLGLAALAAFSGAAALRRRSRPR
jgi:apolipoprotein N-acyltransferase